jgi:hypothetical protein
MDLILRSLAKQFTVKLPACHAIGADASMPWRRHRLRGNLSRLLPRCRRILNLKHACLKHAAPPDSRPVRLFSGTAAVGRFQ